VDSAGSVGEYTSLAFNPGGAPAISYYDRTHGNLKVAVYNGSSWDLSAVDSASDVGLYTSLAFSPGGGVAIAYYDATNGDLKFAIQQGFQVGP
jgi:ribosomal protein L30E